MGLLSQASNIIASLLIGDGSYNAYNNSNAYIGVGDSSAGFNSAHTGLQASSNKTYKGMDVTYPQRTTNQLTFRSTFNPGEAEYAWNEWIVCSSNAGANAFNRAVASLGTKGASATWQLTVTLTLGVA